MKVIVPVAAGLVVTPVSVAVSVVEPPAVIDEGDSDVVRCGTSVSQLAGLPLIVTVELAAGEVIVATLVTLVAEVLTVAVQVMVTLAPAAMVPVQDQEPTPPL